MESASGTGGTPNENHDRFGTPAWHLTAPKPEVTSNGPEDEPPSATSEPPGQFRAMGAKFARVAREWPNTLLFYPAYDSLQGTIWAESRMACGRLSRHALTYVRVGVLAHHLLHPPKRAVGEYAHPTGCQKERRHSHE
jgi:hypothetical protein